MSALEDVATALGGLAVRDAPLGARTTYRVGGTAAVFVEATTIEELLAVGAAISGRDVEVLVVGRGSNLLVADGGFEGVAISLAGAFEHIDDAVERPDGAVHVRAGAAVAYPVLARRCAEAGLRGLEWAVGVPGSVGGAVRMNAGGHGSDTAASLVSAEVVDLRGAAAATRSAAELDLSYRRSSIGRAEVVTAATFSLARGDAGQARALVSEIVAWRRANQPGGANAGSVFANPPGDHAGRLVEAVGAKGLRLGTAAVSEKHANFIQADAAGSADDVVALIDEVRDRVREATGVELRTEVVLVGFEGRS